jgi:phosphonate transport system ATP-binding protein
MISVEALEVVYPSGARALWPTSLTFNPGDFTVLLGASGAGKSTLLRSLNGLVTPTRGQVTISGAALGRGAALRRNRRRIGMIFQQHQLIGRCSVLDNVLTGRLGYRSSIASLLPFPTVEKTRALAALARVGLIDQALRRADQLSGGQQQRVGVARALIQQPEIILADEPVASLDPVTAERVLTLIHGIAKQDGLTAIVSLHQLEFARRFADRIVALAGGQVVFDGPPSALGDAEVATVYGSTPPASQGDAEDEPFSLRQPEELAA